MAWQSLVRLAMSRESLRHLERMITACIAAARTSEELPPRTERGIHHILGLLFAAQDELRVLQARATVELAPAVPGPREAASEP